MSKLCILAAVVLFGATSAATANAQSVKDTIIEEIIIEELLLKSKMLGWAKACKIDTGDAPEKMGRQLGLRVKNRYRKASTLRRIKRLIATSYVDQLMDRTDHDCNTIKHHFTKIDWTPQ